MGVLVTQQGKSTTPSRPLGMGAYCVDVIIVLLDVRCVAKAGVERPSTGGLETAQPEPSLDQVIEHGGEDPIEVV